MRLFAGYSRFVLAGVSTSLLLVLAAIAIASGSGRNPVPGSVPAQAVVTAQAEPTAFTRPPPSGTIEYPGVNVQRASPSIENLAISARIFIGEAVRKGQGVRLKSGPLGVFTPLDVRVETMLVDEVSTPPEMRYVEFGGTLEDGTVRRVHGMSPTVEVGRRYVFCTLPIVADNHEYDLRYMAVNYALAVDDAGLVTDIGADGTERKVLLPVAIERIKQGAARARFDLSRR